MINRIASTIVRRAGFIIIGLCVLVGGATYVASGGQAVEQASERMRERVMPKTASGDIVVIAIDQESISRIHTWPWPRSTHGRFIDSINRYGAKRAVFDVDFSSDSTDPKEDEAFAAALRRSKAKVAMIGSQDVVKGQPLEVEPNATIRPYIETVSGWVEVDTETNEIFIPLGKNLAGAFRASISTAAVGMKATKGETKIDWSTGYRSIPVISYAEVLEGEIPADALRDKTVIVGATAMTLGDRWTAPDGYRIPGVVIHAMAAETLLRHVPVDHGSLPLLLVAMLLVLLAVRTRERLTGSFIGLAIGALIVAASWMAREHYAYVLGVAPALALVTTYVFAQIAAAITTAVIVKITTDDITDLPNLTAMRIDRPAGASTIAFRIRNHLDTALALGPDLQAELLRRVRDRIRIAAGEERIYQVDEHSFVWRSPLEDTDLSDNVEGLAALFAGGIHIGGKIVDVPVTAGICDDEEDVQRSVINALLAADQAAREGLPWTRHHDDAEAAEWRVTVMSELEQALSGNEEAGRVWVAYQPKYDLQSDRIVSAEALVRWTHPVKGPIRPDHFIPILEETGRIENLTHYVLERAIRDFSMVKGMSVAVNLSTRILGHGNIVGPIQEMLRKYGMAPNQLILEITESAVLTGDEAIAELDELRDMGVKISIDDYGTGQSTLNYLKRLPATELKIDQSFIRVVLTSKSDQVMIASTINLAHQLGLKVVAEGVETVEVLEALRGLDCDIIQGYHIGKPMPFGDFIRDVAQGIIMPRAVGQ